MLNECLQNEGDPLEYRRSSTLQDAQQVSVQMPEPHQVHGQDQNVWSKGWEFQKK